MNFWRSLILIAVTPALASYSQGNPRFEITRSVIGGGSPSVQTENGYSLASTVAQPATAPMANGRFSIHAGFWVWPAATIFGARKMGPDFIFSVQTEIGKNYVIQHIESVTGTNWQSLPAFTGDGSVKHTIVTAPLTGHRFYRLVEQ